jgi:CCR4-NOT transcription complex subunit 7/8
MLIKDNTNYFHGGLSRLISSLNIERKGINHQAGSDAIATIEAFHKLIKNENISNKTLKRFKNVLYGIGIGEDNQNTIKYINNSNNNINMNNVNNFNVSNRNPSNINNNTVFNRNMMYIQNQIKNNYMNNYIKCFYPCILINNAIKNNILMNQMKLAQAMMA